MKSSIRRFRPLFAITILILVIALLPFRTAVGYNSTFAQNPAVSASEVVQNPYIGIWISGAELANLPTSGTAWNALKSAADQNPGTPIISDQDENNDVFVLAKALVYARTGNVTYRDAVISNLTKAMGTEAGGRTLALGRNLVSYVIAADLINLPANSSIDQSFRSWLKTTLSETMTDSRTLRQTQEERPNNWGNHAGASRAAVALYLGDKAELDRTALVFRGYVGDRAAYHGFIYGDDLTWQCDPNNPVGINPVGCVKAGHSIDGVEPDDQRRGGSFTWPPIATGYPWEALQGSVVEAQILTRAGYPAFQWQNQAILRTVKFLYSINWPATGDDAFLVWIINRAYGTNYPASSPAGHGKNMGWTDWSLSTGSGTGGTAPTATLVKLVTAAPTATPVKLVTAAPTVLATATKLPTIAPSPTKAPINGPTATPVQSSATLIKAMTFENGSLVNSTSGADKVSGSATLDKSSAVSGVYSAAIANIGNAYLEENYQGVDQVFISFAIKLKSLPSSSARILLISNSGTTVGNILINTKGSLQLRNASTSIDSASPALALNTIYRVGIHQTRGSSGNAVLEAYLAPAGQSFGAPFASMSNGAWTTQSNRVRIGSTTSAAANVLVDDIYVDSGKMH